MKKTYSYPEFNISVLKEEEILTDSPMDLDKINESTGEWIGDW